LPYNQRLGLIVPKAEPSAAITAKVPISETGIAMIGMIAVRQDWRKMIAASAAAANSVLPRDWLSNSQSQRTTAVDLLARYDALQHATAAGL
jgi:hypothetical protein